MDMFYAAIEIRDSLDEDGPLKPDLPVAVGDLAMI
jgi:hypothetical protein